ncbi:MAG TPA: dockerin type I repeat-containing protein [Tepidisphaeraceae bacterium]|nr:dockerin type I repeat-containing protein [Tepidisphaeraceae bacterium]
MTKLHLSAISALVFSAASVHAVTSVSTYDTLGSSNSYIAVSAAIGNVGGSDPAQQALQFTASQTVKLTDLDLVLGTVLIGHGSGAATVELHLDNGNTPGALVESWATPSVTSTTGTLLSLPATGATLAANTKYWLTVTSAPSSLLGGGWFMSSTTVPAGILVANRYGSTDPWNNFTYYKPEAVRLTGDAVIPGDANEDGKISVDDYALLDRGFSKHLTGWNNGDFNGDNQINSADYAILDAASLAQNALSPALLAAHEAEFGPTYASQLAAAVPEPTALLSLLPALPFLIRRRSR